MILTVLFLGGGCASTSTDFHKQGLFSNDFFEINGVKYAFNTDDKEFTESSADDAVITYHTTSLGWNYYEFAGSEYSILKFNYDWYSIISYIFVNEDIVVNNTFRVGETYNSIIKKCGKPDRERYSLPIYKKLQYGELFYGRNTYSISKIELLINNDNKIFEIHFNIIEMNIPEDLVSILSNEWINPAAHTPESRFVFSTDNTFTYYHWEIVDGNNILRGTWKLVTENNVPKIYLQFIGYDHISGIYEINRIEDSRYSILFNNKFYFWPKLEY
jgi:hypothetical protein